MKFYIRLCIYALYINETHQSIKNTSWKKTSKYLEKPSKYIIYLDANDLYGWVIRFVLVG